MARKIQVTYSDQNMTWPIDVSAADTFATVKNKVRTALTHVNINDITLTYNGRVVDDSTNVLSVIGKKKGKKAEIPTVTITTARLYSSYLPTRYQPVMRASSRTPNEEIITNLIAQQLNGQTPNFQALRNTNNQVTFPTPTDFGINDNDADMRRAIEESLRAQNTSVSTSTPFLSPVDEYEDTQEIDPELDPELATAIALSRNEYQHSNSSEDFEDTQDELDPELAAAIALSRTENQLPKKEVKKERADSEDEDLLGELPPLTNKEVKKETPVHFNFTKMINRYASISNDSMTSTTSAPGEKKRKEREYTLKHNDQTNPRKRVKEEKKELPLHSFNQSKGTTKLPSINSPEVPKEQRPKVLNLCISLFAGTEFNSIADVQKPEKHFRIFSAPGFKPVYVENGVKIVNLLKRLQEEFGYQINVCNLGKQPNHMRVIQNVALKDNKLDTKFLTNSLIDITAEEYGPRMMANPTTFTRENLAAELKAMVAQEMSRDVTEERKAKSNKKM